MVVEWVSKLLIMLIGLLVILVLFTMFGEKLFGFLGIQAAPNEAYFSASHGEIRLTCDPYTLTVKDLGINYPGKSEVNVFVVVFLKGQAKSTGDIITLVPGGGNAVDIREMSFTPDTRLPRSEAEPFFIGLFKDNTNCKSLATAETSDEKFIAECAKYNVGNVQLSELPKCGDTIGIGLPDFKAEITGVETSDAGDDNCRVDFTIKNSGKEPWLDDMKVKGTIMCTTESLENRNLGMPFPFNAYLALESGKSSKISEIIGNTLDCKKSQESNSDWLIEIYRNCELNEYGRCPVTVGTHKIGSATFRCD